VDDEFQKLLGTDVGTVAQLSDTELLARLIRGEPTQAVREKTVIVATLLKEAGDLARVDNRVEQGRTLHLKGLHLLLDVLAQEEPFEYPEFVPRIEGFVAALAETDLPVTTQVRLMQHYERVGDFAKAEDCLFAMLESGPHNAGLAEFGIAFYERLQRQTDASLAAGNLPRVELEASLAELRTKNG
jgi:hypothetical protein